MSKRLCLQELVQPILMRTFMVVQRAKRKSLLPMDLVLATKVSLNE